MIDRNATGVAGSIAAMRHPWPIGQTQRAETWFS
jgi:hypothetical protein